MAAVDDVPRVLARNNACHQCRKRKLRCDANRPRCGHCSKPRVRGAAAHAPPEECTWDPAKLEGEPSSSTSAGTGVRRNRSESDDQDGEGSMSGAGRGKKNKLDVLESRLSAFESVVRPGNPDSGIRSTRPMVAPSASSSVTDVNRWTTLASRPLLPARPLGAPAPATSAGPTPFLAPELPYDDLEWGANDPYAGLGEPSDATALVWPDWPRDLPSFQVVQHAAGVFFDKIPTLPKMLHRATFLAQLQLPPSHYAFPCPALLHAILAITANHMSEAALASSAYFPVGTPHGAFEHPTRDLDPEQEPARILGFGAGWRYYASESPVAKFQLWHRRKAYESCPVFFDRGEKLLQCVQAHIIATAVDQYNAWWVDLWMEAGACLRMTVPLGLNESKNVHPDSLGLTMSKELLRPAVTPQEHDERVRTWWMAYMLERSTSFATTWPASLDDDDITIELPILQQAFDAVIGGGVKGIQSLHAPDFYSVYPPEHADSLNVLIKAHKLQGEVGRFFRRYSKGPHSTKAYAADPALHTLLSKFSTLRMSCPSHLRRPTQLLNGSVDVDLVAATMITHAGSVTLAEPLITVDSWTHDISRMCLTAIRSVLSILYDMTLLPPTVPWAWTMSARCLLRFITAAGEAGDVVSVQVFSSEVEVFRLALRRYGERYPIGHKHLVLIDNLIDRSRPLNGPMCHEDDAFQAVTISAIGTNSGGSTRTTPSFTVLHTPPGHSCVAADMSMSTSASTSGVGAGSNGLSAGLAAAMPNTIDNIAMAFSADNPSGTTGYSGFDVSSFSFDFDALSEMFASSETVFNGSDFVLK